MFLSDASVRRPVAVSCLIIAFVLLGVNAYRKIGLEYLPKLDMPFITVLAVYPGASPAEVETDVAKKIEDQVVAVDGLRHVTSSCMENMCLVLLEFEMEVDVDEAANDVREKIDLILNDLPAGVEKPQILKFDVNAKPIINLALTGDVSIDELFDYADNTLRDRLSVLAGVADVQLIGGAEREVNVLLDRDQLAARGLTAMDVVQTLQRGIGTIPSGRLRQGATEYAVKFDAEYKSPEQIGELEVGNAGGARCYLRDLGEVCMASEERRQAAFIDGRSCIGIRVVKKADANAVRVVARVREALGGVRDLLPGGMDLIWISDDAAFIRSSVDSTTLSIGQGVLLTALILFLFLYNVRSTFIVAVSMPLTIVISLFFLHLLGYTLNTSTLLAAGLSVGILVTNSIVVLESIVKRVKTWDTAREAARIGAGDVAIAVLASAGTNVVVLFPVAIMGSMVGRFFRPFAVTMVIVTLVSLFMSFTLTPILCAVLLRGGRGTGTVSLLGRIEAAWNRMFEGFSRGYTRMLALITRYRWSSVLFLLLVAALFIHALNLAPRIGFTFVEEPDRGEVYVKLEYPTRYRLKETLTRVQQVEDQLRDLPGLKHTFTTVGKVEGILGQASEGVYLAQILLSFIDKTERAQTTDELLTDIRARLEHMPGCIVTASVPSGIGGQNSPIELELAGEDLERLDELAKSVQALAGRVNGVIDTDTTARVGKPEIRVHPRRPVLADLSLPATSLGMVLRANIEGIKAATFKRGDRSYDIRVKLRERDGVSQLSEFLFPGVPGRPMTLTNLAQLEEKTAPVQITRSDKRRISKLFGNLLGGKPLGTAVNEISQAIDERNLLPAGYRYRFVGMYEYMSEAQAAMLEAAVMALVLTYLVLAAILESFHKPFIILVTIPLGLVGMLWALYLTGQSISIFVLLGGVMLVGIVVNNAILIMERVRKHIEEGMSEREAMLAAAGDELRPILMITLAAVLGMLPLALGKGLGSEMRAGIGIASVGGIAISAVLTLLVLPVLFELFARRESPADEQP